MNKTVYLLDSIEGRVKRKEDEEVEVQVTLRAARVNLGLTRKEAAQYLGVHYETLANYECNSTKIPVSVFKRAQDVYGVPSENFYLGKEKDFFEEKQKTLLSTVC
jgi:transcriptional regulator with XRE-family HTH domain